MKRNIILIAALGLLFGCGNNNSQTNNPESKQEAFSVETYDVEDSRVLATTGEGEDAHEERAFFRCTIDIPVTDNQALYDSICNWFAQTMDKDQNEDPRDVKSMVNSYKDDILKPIDNDDPEGFDASLDFEMLEANDRYVTYKRYDFNEANSAPRSNQEWVCITFNSHTGKRFTRQMVHEDDTLEELVMNALLEQFFSDWQSDALDDILNFDPEFLEERGFWLPKTDPFILHDSLYFFYWEHDIANRVAGQPYCSLPFSLIEKYLTEEGKAFFKASK